MADNVEEADPAQENFSRFASLQCNEPLAGSVSEKCTAILSGDEIAGTDAGAVSSDRS
jgi:hypothetical protein